MLYYGNFFTKLWIKLMTLAAEVLINNKKKTN